MSTSETGCTVGKPWRPQHLETTREFINAPACAARTRRSENGKRKPKGSKALAIETARYLTRRTWTVEPAVEMAAERLGLITLNEPPIDAEFLAPLTVVPATGWWITPTRTGQYDPDDESEPFDGFDYMVAWRPAALRRTRPAQSSFSPRWEFVHRARTLASQRLQPRKLGHSGLNWQSNNGCPSEAPFPVSYSLLAVANRRLVALTRVINASLSWGGKPHTAAGRFSLLLLGC